MHGRQVLLLVLSLLAACHKGPRWQREARVANTSFSAVWGSAADDVWLGGLGALLHWDGTTLQAVKLENHPAEVISIWGASRRDVWISTGSEDTFRHFDGQRWSSVGPARARGGGALWGFGRDDVWSCCTFPDRPGSWNGAAHWNGSTWSVVPISVGGEPELLRIWGAGPHDLWLAGQGGRVVHGDGTRWTLVPSGVKQDIAAIWGSGSADVWFAGGDGVLLHWDGKALVSVPSGSTQNLAGLWGTGPDDVWAVGGEGLGSFTSTLHWDGHQWSAAAGNNVLMAVWGASPRDVWAAGHDGVVEHFH